MVCADHNVYTTQQKTKYEMCQKLINIPLIYYLDIIKNCNEIYIIDSCFTGIVLPLLKTKQLNAKIVRIIKRNLSIIL